MILTGIPGTSFQLDAPAEGSWERTKDAGNPAVITTAYRDAAYQKRLYDLYLAGKGSFALPPGKSLHERGLAVDVNQATADWMAAHGAAYGWSRPSGWDASVIRVAKREWWHFEYVASNDQHATAGGSTMTAFDTWDYHNDDAGPGGEKPVYRLVINTSWDAASAAKSSAEANAKADAILAAIGKMSAPTAGAIDLDVLAEKVAALVPAPKLSAADINAIADELDKREVARLTQVKDA